MAAYVDSEYRHRCGKRMVVELGQHEDSGEVVESHLCLHCDAAFDSLPERRAPDLAQSPPRPLWAILEQYVEIRTRHLDRPEARAQLGLDA